MGRRNSSDAAESSATQYLQDQISFMQTQISKLQNDLAEKEVTIQKIAHEKREAMKHFDILEARNNALEEVLSGERIAKQEALKAMENMKLILAAN